MLTLDFWLFKSQNLIDARRSNKPYLLFLLGFILVSGCTPLNPNHPLPPRLPKAVSQAQAHHFVEKRIVSGPFKLTTFKEPLVAQYPLIVYIEGDGQSWIRFNLLSKNPTPKRALPLSLALLDPRPNRIYLARPCQYTPLDEDPNCHPKYWSSHRYSPEVLHSYHAALDHLKVTPTQKIHLIGYSGGGAIATLLTATRPDILSLTTIAGDLNHHALSQLHHTTPLTHSLNPYDFRHALSHTPQRHLVGKRDPIIPPTLAQDFVQQLPKPHCAQWHLFAHVSHFKGWKALWPSPILTPLPQCAPANTR